MKSIIINNRFFSSVAIVRISINEFIKEINKVPINIIDRLCVKM